MSGSSQCPGDKILTWFVIINYLHKHKHLAEAEPGQLQLLEGENNEPVNEDLTPGYRALFSPPCSLCCQLPEKMSTLEIKNLENFS